jgi:hypothetical protein
MLSFNHHAFTSSPINPCNAFVGVFASTLFAVPGAGRLEGESSMWVRHGDPKDNKRTLKYVGSPDTVMNWSPEEDAADVTIALITSEWAEKGGFFRRSSETFSPRQLKETFERVRPGAHVELQQIMDTDAMYNLMMQVKEAAIAAGSDEYQARSWDILGLQYGYHMAAATLIFDSVDDDKFPDAKKTTLEEYIRDNDYV